MSAQSPLAISGASTRLLRRSHMERFSVCLALIVLAGCQAQTPAVHLQGEPVALSRLAGQWDGQYWGGSSGRRGVISFSLAAGSDTLYGDVTMLGLQGQPLNTVDAPDVHKAHVRVARSLRIDFVRAASDAVAGTLEPYMAPDCNCVVSTTFRGTIVADTISGAFVTRNAGTLLSEGSWRVVRRGTSR
jgi:hypothetical protein